MEKCNSDLARYVRNTYYDRLNVLPPTERFVESFRLALAAASANCLSAFPGSFSPSDADAIARRIEFSEA